MNRLLGGKINTITIEEAREKIASIDMKKLPIKQKIAMQKYKLQIAKMEKQRMDAEKVLQRK